MPPKRQPRTTAPSKSQSQKRPAADTAKSNPKRADAPGGKRKDAGPPPSPPSLKPEKRQKKQPTPTPISTRNTPPTRILDVYPFGTNCYGELGLGDLTKKSEINRPVLNTKLDAGTVGVVYLAIGGVHSAVLTRDNTILTWGVNDEGALGRDTTEEKSDEEDMVSNNDSEGEGSDVDSEDGINLNLKEATPFPVDSSGFPDGTVFTQLAATDSATFALSREGLVYGWGNFRGGSGEVGFSPNHQGKEKQRTPVLIPGLKDVVKLANGAQHMLALTSTGSVFGWGCDEQHQLGRRRASRFHQPHPLTPDQCALPPGIVDIASGLYHSFAIHKNGSVYAWGSNNFGQTAIATSAGQSGALVLYPTEARSFRRHARITSIFGGKDHSLAITEHGQCLTWGRIDNKALGIVLDDMSPSDIIFDEYDRPRILKQPTAIASVTEQIVNAAIGSDHSFILTDEGKAYSWGFNAEHQTGQIGEEEVTRPTLLQSKHVDGKKIVSAAAGGQFSIVAGEHAF